jgi:hypothetical protein
MMTEEEFEEWKAHRKLLGDSLRNLHQSFEQTLEAIKYVKLRYIETANFEGAAMIRDIEKRILESKAIFEDKENSAQ